MRVKLRIEILNLVLSKDINSCLHSFSTVADTIIFSQTIWYLDI